MTTELITYHEAVKLTPNLDHPTVGIIGRLGDYQLIRTGDGYTLVTEFSRTGHVIRAALYEESGSEPTTSVQAIQHYIGHEGRVVCCTEDVYNPPWDTD